MPDYDRYAALQEHFDRRMTELFGVVERNNNNTAALIEDKNKTITSLAVSIGKLEVGVSDSLRQTKDISAEVAKLAGQVDMVKNSAETATNNLANRLDELFHMRSWAKGMLLPLGGMLTILMLGIGELIKQTVDKMLK